MKPEVVKSILNNIIAELSADPSLFVAHPGKDFTRDRKLPLETMLKIIIGMNGGSIKRELYCSLHSSIHAAVVLPSEPPPSAVLYHKVFLHAMRIIILP